MVLIRIFWYFSNCDQDLEMSNIWLGQLHEIRDGRHFYGLFAINDVPASLATNTIDQGSNSAGLMVVMTVQHGARETFPLLVTNYQKTCCWWVSVVLYVGSVLW